ncbi:MAG: Asp-tRNA(Asn)/Glu-tRNA(Gln) amidotransferase subunit GatC [Actinomycetaceae bacterium]|nr:Asp-tRNA(Asn)/Glu-tRNA(Gln) amidotransferase subunit GatC [Actinomycetaceae bacterium]
MSNISREELSRIAAVAHIVLTDEETERFARDLGALEDRLERIAALDTEGVPETVNPIPLVNVWRDDVVGEVLDREEVLAQAPAAEDGMFQVPQMLGEE